MSKDKDILMINNLSKTYYTPKKEIMAIDDVNIRVKDDEIIAIVGPSGCGKSTLLNILGGFEDKTSGEIVFPMGEKKIGYMFQTDCLFEWLTIKDNCLLGLKIQNQLTEENEEYVVNLLKCYGLGEFVNSYPSSLSGGMRQRVL